MQQGVLLAAVMQTKLHMLEIALLDVSLFRLDYNNLVLVTFGNS